MVKQGHYARSSRKQRVRQLKQHHQVQADHVIEPTAITEFLLVRYHLTRGKKQRPVVRKTMQQFLTQWLALATPTSTWSVTEITAKTLQQFNLQLPWQGYAIVSEAWADFQAFLVKEVPAVPLQERLRLVEPLSTVQWQQVLSQQLAVNALLGLLGKNEQQLSQLTTAQIRQLQTSIQTATGIDWVKVASLLTPTSKNVTVTAQNQTWFGQLEKLNPNDFD